MKYNHFNCQQNNSQANISKRTIDHRQIKSSRNHSSHNSQFVCNNHPNKFATHIFDNQENDQYRYYCEKCAIMLASKGFNVIKINQNKNKNKMSLSLSTTQMSNRVHSSQAVSHNSQRMSQIKQFLIQVAAFNRQLQQKNNQLKQTLLVSQQEYTQLIQKVNNYFTQIEETLQLQKYLCYNQILSKRVDNENQTRVLKGNVQSALQQINTMINDIISNQEVVESVDDKLYQNIMANYRHKLDIINEVLTIEANYPFKFHIDFPQIYSQFLYIADKIHVLTIKNAEIHSSSSSQQDQDQNVVSPYFLTPGAEGNKQKNISQVPKAKTMNSLKNLTKQELAFSYDSSQQNCNTKNSHFHLGKNQQNQKFHPQQIMLLRDSLNLTEIQDQQEIHYTNQKYSKTQRMLNFEDYGMITSQQSLAAYFNSEEHLKQSRQQGELNETQTLLIQ